MSKSVRNSRKQHRNHGHRASLRRTAEPAHIKPRPGPTARKRKRRQSRARRRQLLVLLIAAVLIALIAALVHQPSTSGSTSGTGAASDDRPLETNITHGLISDAVVAYRDVVADYAEQNGISEYTDVLLAIMQVESGGELDDLMQSSGSLELPSDSLSRRPPSGRDAATLRTCCTARRARAATSTPSSRPTTTAAALLIMSPNTAGNIRSSCPKSSHSSSRAVRPSPMTTRSPSSATTAGAMPTAICSTQSWSISIS